MQNSDWPSALLILRPNKISLVTLPTKTVPSMSSSSYEETLLSDNISQRNWPITIASVPSLSINYLAQPSSSHNIQLNITFLLGSLKMVTHLIIFIGQYCRPTCLLIFIGTESRQIAQMFCHPICSIFLGWLSADIGITALVDWSSSLLILSIFKFPDNYLTIVL